VHRFRKGHSHHHHKYCNGSGHLELSRRIYCIPTLPFRNIVLFGLRFESVVDPEKGILQFLETGVLGALVKFAEPNSPVRLLEVRARAINIYNGAQVHITNHQV
jgi:hypothetical protein